jgi:hypothetical protein
MNLKRRNAAAVVRYLEGLGYEDLRLVESEQRIHSENAHDAARGHLFCRFGRSGRGPESVLP